MFCCHNCPRRTEGCSAACEDRIIEKLATDLVKIRSRRKRYAERAADGVIISRWERKHRRKTRQM